LEKLLTVVDGIVANRETGAKLRGLRINPNALINFKAFVARLYHLPEGTTDKGWNFHAKYHHIFVAGACGADLQVRKLLHTQYDVWEGVPPFSLHDLVGSWIPTNHGVVNAIYSPTSTRVEPYCTYVSDPHVLPFTPMFVGLSLVSMRKANNKDKPKGGRNALAAAAAPETETKISGGSGEGEVAGAAAAARARLLEAAAAAKAIVGAMMEASALWT